MSFTFSCLFAVSLSVNGLDTPSLSLSSILLSADILYRRYLSILGVNAVFGHMLSECTQSMDISIENVPYRMADRLDTVRLVAVPGKVRDHNMVHNDTRYGVI